MVTHCNRAFENLTGISFNEIVGTNRHWLAFYSAKRPVLADLIVDRATQEEIVKFYGSTCRKSQVVEGAYEAEAFFSDPWDEGKWLFFTAAPLKDERDRIMGAVETLQDITEHKRTEEALRKSEHRYRDLLDLLPSPVALITAQGHVSYLNSAFSQTFGWTLEELKGKKIPFIPPDIDDALFEDGKRSRQKTSSIQRESKRLTKDGKILDVSISSTVFSETGDGPAAELVILRDITQEKRIARQNEAVLQISRALPEYPDYEELLEFVRGEVKRLLASQKAIVILRDEDNKELFLPGTTCDYSNSPATAESLPFPMNQLAVGKVIRTADAVIVNDSLEGPGLSLGPGERPGHRIKNQLLVPLRSFDRIIGVLCAADKKHGNFDESDRDLLNMIAGTVALSIENARFSEEIKRAYREVTDLNRAKDRVINHLSHELKTPTSILYTNLKILKRKLCQLKDLTWQPAMDRSERNLDRILEIQYKVHDIMRDKHYQIHGMLSLLLDRCADILETLVAEQVGEGPVIARIRNRIDELFGTQEALPGEIHASEFIKRRLERLKQQFSHRQVDIFAHLDSLPLLYLPADVLEKIIDALVKNAVENTPDEGKIEIQFQKKGNACVLSVHDFGTGITEEARKQIFEGFYTTRETLDYSSKRPFDFNAGGKGTDLLRIKTFSERYGFQIQMVSSRCRFIPKNSDLCPGKISRCRFCATVEDCRHSGETTFSIVFPGPLQVQSQDKERGHGH